MAPVSIQRKRPIWRRVIRRRPSSHPIGGFGDCKRVLPTVDVPVSVPVDCIAGVYVSRALVTGAIAV